MTRPVKPAGMPAASAARPRAARGPFAARMRAGYTGQPTTI